MEIHPALVSVVPLLIAVVAAIRKFWGDYIPTPLVPILVLALCIITTSLAMAPLNTLLFNDAQNCLLLWLITMGAWSGGKAIIGK